MAKGSGLAVGLSVIALAGAGYAVWTTMPKTPKPPVGGGQTPPPAVAHVFVTHFQGATIVDWTPAPATWNGQPLAGYAISVDYGNGSLQPLANLFNPPYGAGPAVRVGITPAYLAADGSIALGSMVTVNT